ncbi:MAG TPA: C1 family peptidase [Bryobacteraceae bacterium]|jgi:C1A family cysteine protease|nr:C1 family peptidase [Bryobacteraceae bacterium]
MPLNVGTFIEANRRVNASWTAAENFITALEDDARRIRLGYRPGPGEFALEEREQVSSATLERSDNAAAAAAAAAAYPAAFDWRDVGGSNYISGIKDQGNCGSCVAFGTAAAIDAAMRIAKQIPVGSNRSGVLDDVSEAQLFYCGTSNACGLGWYVSAALAFATSPGLVPESEYPYTAGNQACAPPNDWHAITTAVGSSAGYSSPTQMKQALATTGPLITCFSVYQDFYSYSSGVYRHHSGSLEGGHCVCCIGYSDELGAWLCKNSWGTGWGEQGYFWIAYGQCGIDAYMYSVQALSRIWMRTAVAGSPLASMLVGSGDPRYYYMGGQGHVQELAWSGGRWSHRDLTTEAQGAPPALAKDVLAAMGTGGSLDPRVYYLALANNHVHELAWVSGAWHDRDLTQETSGPAPTALSQVAALGSGGSLDPRVYYLSADKHVQELAWSGGGWHVRDVTASASAPGAAPSVVTGFATGSSRDPRVYYTTPDQHIHELAWVSGGWHHRDITSDAGAAPNAGTSIRAMGVGTSLDPLVYYISNGSHIHELGWSGGSWHDRDVTKDSGAPAAGGAALAAVGVGSAHDPRVYYAAGNGHIHELAWANGGWHHRDISQESGASAINANSPLTATVVSNSADPRVYFLDNNGDTCELAFISGAWHFRNVLGGTLTALGAAAGR